EQNKLDTHFWKSTLPKPPPPTGLTGLAFISSSFGLSTTTELLPFNSNKNKNNTNSFFPWVSKFSGVCIFLALVEKELCRGFHVAGDCHKSFVRMTPCVTRFSANFNARSAFSTSEKM